MGGLIVAIPLLVFAVRSNKHRAAENTDPFASSRNKAAVESADIVIQAARDAAKREKVRFVREAEEGAPGKEARFTQQESKSTPKEALLSPDADIRAQQHSASPLVGDTY